MDSRQVRFVASYPLHCLDRCTGSPVLNQVAFPVFRPAPERRWLSRYLTVTDRYFTKGMNRLMGRAKNDAPNKMAPRISNVKEGPATPSGN